MNSSAIATGGYSIYQGHFETGDSVNLSQVIVKGTTKAPNGGTMYESILERVEAQKGLYLVSTAASYVESSQGCVYWSNWNPHHEQTCIPDVKGRKDVGLSNISARNVTSLQGEVKIVGGSVQSAEARDGAVLRDTVVETCKVSQGSLNAFNTRLTKVEARDRAQLEKSTSDTVKVSQGGLNLKNSEITKAECRQELVSEKSRIQSLLLHVDPKNTGKIVLSESSIQSLTIKKIQNKCLPSPARIGTLTIRDVEIDGIDDAQALLNRYAKTADILGGGEITLNGHKFVKDRATGQYLPYRPESEPRQVHSSNSKDVVTIELNGGVVEGNVEFRDCVGRVRLLGNSKILGYVLGGEIVESDI